MASTQSKLSGGGKAGARSVSTSRLVAQKTVKAQKIAAPVKSRTSQSNPPAATGKSSSRWPKSRTSAPPSADPKTEVRSTAAGSIEDKTRSGASKSELKTQFAKLSSATSQIAGFKRSLNKTFFDIGALLNQIRNERLYEVKGYGSFESFVEREIDINKALCLKIVRIAEVFHREHAVGAGLERAAAAVAALDGEAEQTSGFRPAGSPAGGIPVHKQ
jgi:hypothetical protein